MNLGPFWTLPNLMSLARVAIVPFLLAALAEPDPVAARPRVLAWLALAFVTDWFDGRIARWTNQVSDWGRVLDPVADKLFVIGVAAGLVAYRGFPLALLAALAARDAGIVLVAARMARRGARIPSSNAMGRVAMCVFSLTLLVYALPAPAFMTAAVVATIVFAIASTVSYVRAALARRVAVRADHPLAAR